MIGIILLCLVCFEKILTQGQKWLFFLLLGISYLSEAQESAAKVRMGNPMAVDHATKSSSSPALSVADTVFIERVRSRVKHWKNACTDSDIKTEGKL